MDLLTAAIYEIIDHIPVLRLEFSNGSTHYLDTFTQKTVLTDNGFIFISDAVIARTNAPLVVHDADVEIKTADGTIKIRLTYNDDPRLLELFKRFASDVENDRFTVGLDISKL